MSDQEAAEQSAAEQGFPPHVEDHSVLATVASLVTGTLDA